MSTQDKFQELDGIYNIHPIVKGYLQADSFNAILNPKQFFKDVSTVGFTVESSYDVNKRVNDQDVDSNTFTPLSTSPMLKKTVVESKLRVLPSFTASLPVSRIDDIINNIYVQNVDTQLHKDNKKFDRYMMDIISPICMKKFSNTIALITSQTGITNQSQFPDFMNTIKRLQQLNNSQKAVLFSMIVGQAQKILGQIFVKKAKERTVLGMKMINDLKFGGTNFTRPTFYQLREGLMQSMSIPAIVLKMDSFSMEQYVKNILADIFIVTSYPLIHYMVLDSIELVATNYGKLVNQRLAVLAKVFFTNSYVTFLRENIFEVNRSRISDVQKYEELFNVIEAKLNQYLNYTSEVFQNSNGAKYDLNKIILQVHGMSSVVEQKASSIKTIKTESSSNQMALRTIIENEKSIEPAYNKAYKIYTAVLSIVIIVNVLLFCIFIYTIVSPNAAMYKKTIWLYCALVIFIIGIILFSITFFIK